MAKKVSIDFNFKIPRAGEATFTLAAPVDDLKSDNVLTADEVTQYVLTTIGMGTEGIAQVKVTNAREVIRAWKEAQEKAATKAA